MNPLSNLLSIRELTSLTSDKSTHLLDCSWHLPVKNRNPRKEYLQQHIPGAQFFDIDEVCDKGTEFPHMLPTAKQFSSAVSSLGISNHSLVVCYDSHGLFSAARVWWMFKIFGHTNVKVVNGGLPQWLAESGASCYGSEAIVPGSYKAVLNQAAVVDLHQIEANIKTGEAIVIDARPKGRFIGELPEPRPELRSGHISGSLSLPYTELMENGQLKTKEQLLDAFKKLGITGQQKVITSCGSGVTAAILTLALAECGFGIHRLYDGAWTEWASRMPSH